MSDREKKMSDEEEYQFPNEEYTADADSVSHTDDQDHSEELENPYADELGEASQSAKKSLFQRFPFLRNKRVLIIIGVAVLLIIIFNVYNKMTNHTKIIEKVKPEQVINRSPVIKQTQTSSTNQFSAPNPQMLTQVSQLQQSSSDQQAHITQLQTQVQSLTQKINEMQKNSTTLDNSVTALIAQMRDVTRMVQDDQSQASAQTASSQTITVKPKAPPVVVYSLMAVVPGRAWLLGSNGISTTVRVGQHLKHYGKILAIRPNQGLVLTSSGKIIGYGQDDS